jgi:hypothetical protein
MTREVVRKVVAVGWYPYVPFDQQEHPKLLSDDTGKTTGVLDQDRADTVALDAIKLNNNAPFQVDFLKWGGPPFLENRNRKRDSFARHGWRSGSLVPPGDLMNTEDCQNENSRPDWNGGRLS